MLAAAAAAGDDATKLAQLEPYLTRHLEGDTRAWADYERFVALQEDTFAVGKTNGSCCEAPDIVFDVADDRVCRTCGTCHLIGPTSVAARKEAVHQLSRTNVTYERRNHWNEFMNCVLAREATVLPDLVRATVCAENPSTVRDVHLILRKHNLQKYYKNIYRLYRDATQRAAVVLDSEEEHILQRYFRHAEQTWISSSPPDSEKRHNFLRNTFLLGMFARVLMMQRPWDATRWRHVACLMLPTLPSETSSAMRIWMRIAAHAKWSWRRDL
mgnify:CR=1 FL=1